MKKRLNGKGIAVTRATNLSVSIVEIANGTRLLFIRTSNFIKMCSRKSRSGTSLIYVKRS